MTCTIGMWRAIAYTHSSCRPRRTSFFHNRMLTLFRTADTSASCHLAALQVPHQALLLVLHLVGQMVQHNAPQVRGVAVLLWWRSQWIVCCAYSGYHTSGTARQRCEDAGCPVAPWPTYCVPCKPQNGAAVMGSFSSRHRWNTVQQRERVLRVYTNTCHCGMLGTLCCDCKGYWQVDQTLCHGACM
jgi:hypothetical protein